jgi:citrate lyase subunit beta/citryl-CoA lyase
MTEATAWHEAGPRSLLFVPGDKAESLLPKAAWSGADGAIIDLEDAVAPTAKEEARRIGSASIARADLPIPVVARVNPVPSRWFDAAVAAVVTAGASGIVPEVRGHGLRRCPLRSLGDRATARGVLAADAIADADPRVVGLAFGAEDFSAQMGLRRSRSGRELLHAISQVILAAVAAGRWALDTPCIEPHGAEATRREARLARTLGYAGKLVIHPAQVRPVHDAFAPTAAEVNAARAVVAAFDAMMDNGSGVQMVEGRMIDRPVVIAAQRVLAHAGLRQRERRSRHGRGRTPSRARMERPLLRRLRGWRRVRAPSRPDDCVADERLPPLMERTECFSSTDLDDVYRRGGRRAWRSS